MKSRICASLLIACLPWLAMAQSNDDLYFIPKKEKKTEQKAEVKSVPKQTSNNTTLYAASGSTIVVKDVTGKTRDIDEYNRRYTSRDNTFSMQNDTLYIEEKPYGERGEWVNGFEGSQDDYEYAMRIIRFRSPRYAIPVSSPLYWDVVYGGYASWDWNIYEDGLYAYVFPTSTNPLWWDWRWNWGVAGPRWGFSWGWSSPWYYSSWYSPYWYGGYWGGYWGSYYGGYWGGYWGPAWYHHHHYPYWAGNYRVGHTDYRPSRYTGYSSSRRSTSGFGNTSRFTTSSRRGSSSSVGRVVRPGSGAGSSSSTSVRPSGGGSSFQQNGPSSITRPSRGNGSSYVRPSSTVDRTGSIYSRPSSTRRSSNYNNNRSNTRSSSSYSTPRSSGSSFSRGSSSYSRGSATGGSSSRSSSRGGSSSRR